MSNTSTSSNPPYKELWKESIKGQTIDAKLDSIYEGLGEVQKLVLEQTLPSSEKRIVRRKVHFSPPGDPTKPGFPSITNMVRTFQTLEELEEAYNQATSDEETEILNRINELQLQCNMEDSGIVPETQESGQAGQQIETEVQSRMNEQPESSDEEAHRYRYPHESSRRRRIGGRQLFPHPGHVYPLTNAGATLNIDCVTNTDEVITEWVKALLIYQGVTRTDGDSLKTFLPLTLSGKVADWFQALPTETKAQYLGGTTTNDAQTIINTLENEIRREFLGEDYAQHRQAEKRIKKQKYLTMLYNLQICDINYFDAYTCEFEKYYYKAEVSSSVQNSLNFHNDMFFTKLPYPWSDLLLSKWKAAERPTRTDTLGARIEFARLTLASECEKAYKRKRLQKDQKKLKCKDQLYYPSKFGCSDKPKPKKKFKAKKVKGKKIKKFSKPNKKKKRFFKKKFGKKGKTPKDKNIPEKSTAKQIEKKDCRCWNCNEKGHYANECPQQLNFAGIYSNELFMQIADFEEIAYSEISSEDDILVLSYLSSSDDEFSE